ncbi:DUF3370 domain-containing protein [Trichocoleus sp. FACHB-262]|uniref:DUF3370 domain-containing protein n=1 Tax=Trichocoleus sp. FACHB-262 TaxID=2692869 RepID=UPI00168624E2|nr:DUF3370 domain-containing protein [Trichocoleus sp. FACHB-262]MBD2120177.1 DUF3370 domain-containing protein [Trichocoleus sp. FACHB-262]
MFSLLPLFTLAQATPTPSPPPSEEFVRLQEVRALPGQLDDVLVFNSNSPEVVQKEGILLSTFPSANKRFPAAHLNVPLQGRFDLFAHHIAKATTPEDLKTLYLGAILHNSSSQPVTVDILQAASYLSQPDAPFIELPPYIENPTGSVYAGPGDRAMNDILRGRRQADFPAQLVIPPRESRMLLNLPIPVKTLDPPINGRSTLMRLRSNGPVYLATLGMFAQTNADGNERPPTLKEWENLLNNGELSGPRDRTPTPPDTKTGQVIYSRVAGVAQGSTWQSQLVDSSTNQFLTIPTAGQAFSYGLSTLLAGTLGTNQIQSAPIQARYSDTAYQAHGNYAVQYNLTLPLHNPTSQSQKVTVSLETPLKEDMLSKQGLRFLEPPARQVFFRGSVRVRYNDEGDRPLTQYIHLVQRRGQEGEPLVTLNIPSNQRRLLQVDLLYPPDSTPPQVLTVKTLNTTN